MPHFFRPVSGTTTFIFFGPKDSCGFDSKAVGFVFEFKEIPDWQITDRLDMCAAQDHVFSTSSLAY